MTTVHLVERLQVPTPYVVRPYAGRADHPEMVRVLRAHREHEHDDEMPTLDDFDRAYDHLDGCDPTTDIAIVEHHGVMVAYTRASREDLTAGTRDLVVFTPTVPEHLGEPLIGALIDGNERHMRDWVEGPSRYRAYAARDSPDLPPTRVAAWLETRGYDATEWGAQLVRPHLDEIPERTLPAGVELRPVEPSQVRRILEADFEAFRGEWDFREPTENDFARWFDDDTLDTSLWKVAWAGDEVVGQVKSYISRAENEARGYLRGYTENIATHRDWRNLGIAGTLLALSLQELRDRGMQEAALGVDTNNPGGAFQLYTSLGFEPRSFSAVYTKPV